MPVEIKELIIRATVGDDRQALEGGVGAAAMGARSAGSPARALSPRELDLIVEGCVKHVLRALRKLKER